MKQFEVGFTPQANDEFEQDHGRRPVESVFLFDGPDFMAAKRAAIENFNRNKSPECRDLRPTDLWVREVTNRRDPTKTHD